MTTMMIYRNSDGELINIGEWDDFNGDNPLPDGAYSEDAVVVTGYDGGLYLATDPRKNG